MADLIRVEVEAADAEFTPTDLAEVIALLRAAQRRFDAADGIISRSEDPPSERLAKLLLDGVQAVPLPDGCTGYWDEHALLMHDGDTCPVHELGIED
jgi:hypothetical protein